MMKSITIILHCFIFTFAIVNSEIIVDKPVAKPKCEKDGVHIDLSNNKLTVISDNFLSSPIVNCLTLKDNEIWNISYTAFKNLPNLRYVNLAGNTLPQDDFRYELPTVEVLLLDGAFSYRSKYHFCQNSDYRYGPACQNLRHDQYYGDGLLRLPIFSKLPKLKKIYLRKNKISTMSWNRGAPNITHLYLDNNIIKPEDLFRYVPTTVTHLSLAGNFITMFQHSPVLLHLKELNLDKNQLKILCFDYNCFDEPSTLPQDPEEPTPSLWNVPQTTTSSPRYSTPSHIDLRGAILLERLSIASNQLKYINEGAFNDSQNLEYLDLSHNNIKYIPPEGFKGAGKLKVLLLSNNTLLRVPDFSYVPNLEMLMLDGNRIEEVRSSAFANLANLKTLSLANNTINQLQSDLFASMPLLYELDLSNNKLVILPDNWLLTQSALRRLHLDMNKFTDIEDMSLGNITNFEYLNIAGNPFGLLTVDSLIKLPKNTVLNAADVAFNGDKLSAQCRSED